MSKSILEKDVHLHGKLIRLFRNCPKPSGWFAGVLDDDMLGYVNVSGTCPNLVSKGVVLDMTANLVDGNFGEQYEAYSVSICVENQRALLAYLSGARAGRLPRLRSLFSRATHSSVGPVVSLTASAYIR